MYIQPFKFVIQGYEFEFDRYEIAFCTDGKCHLNIEKINRKFCKEDSYWKIGYMFFHKFLVLFDYDNEEVTFYGRKEIKFNGQEIQNVNNKYKKIGIYFLIGEMIFGISLLFYTSFKIINTSTYSL